MGVLTRHLRQYRERMKKAADKGWAKPGELLPMSRDERQELAEARAKNPAFWRCETHGPAKLGAWGCPDCTKELREQNQRLTEAARLAVETLEWAAERALVAGGSGWKAEVQRCKAAQTALKTALQEFTA